MARRKGRLAVVRLEISQTLSTLANDTVAKAAIHDVSATRGVWSIFCDITLAMQGATPGEGPLYVGVAHSDYSVTEIKECLKADSLDFGNKIEREQAKRLVRDAGVFMNITEDNTLNQGMPIRVKTGFYIEDGKSLDLWVYNKSGASLTTGSSVVCVGKHFVRPSN